MASRGLDIDTYLFAAGAAKTNQVWVATCEQLDAAASAAAACSGAWPAAAGRLQEAGTLAVAWAATCLDPASHAGEAAAGAGPVAWFFWTPQEIEADAALAATLFSATEAGTLELRCPKTREQSKLL